MAKQDKKLKEQFAAYSGLTIRRTPATEDVVLRNIKLMRPLTGAGGAPPPENAGETLVEPFSLTVHKGERLVITGERGCGKSTLLKAIAGLPGISATGEIFLPARARLLHVPQKPYLPPVPMRGILSYPDPYPNPSGHNHTDEEMEEALKAVGLGNYAYTVKDGETSGVRYASQLSLGEQQAIIFARIFLYKPDILFLDEVTASLDKKSRMSLYRLLLEKLPDTTIISIAHNEEIIPLHDRHAHIEGREMKIGPAIVAPPQPESSGPQDSPA